MAHQHIASTTTETPSAYISSKPCSLPIIITHADGRMSIAMSRVCVCDSVCLSVGTVKPKRLKLQSPNLAQG